MNRKIGEFTEIVKVYFKYHIYYWVICATIFCFHLTLLFPGLLIFIIGAYGLLMVGKDIKFGWSSDKIRNLLMYKSLTKTDLTPLESEVVNKHFGTIQRRKIILDDEIRKTVWRKVFLIDILTSLLVISALATVVTGFSHSINVAPAIYSVTGRVIMTEFESSYGFMTSTRQTTIYFENSSLVVLASELTLEIGKTYTIYYRSDSRKVLHVKLID